MYLQNDYEQNALFIELSMYCITHWRLKMYSQFYYFNIKYYKCFDFLINVTVKELKRINDVTDFMILCIVFTCLTYLYHLF